MVSYRQTSRNWGARRLGHIVILAEKPDFGTKIAASIGGCFIQGTELKPDIITNKKFESIIRKERHQKGYFECSAQGKKYIVTWAFGHMVELKQAKDYDARYKVWDLNLFPFIPENYETQVRQDGGIEKHLKLITKLFNDKETEYIINATDADREGELIFHYIYDATNCKKPYFRLWTHSTTEEAILDALSKLKTAKEQYPLQMAGRARSIVDRLVGASLTAVATKKFGGYKNMISIGRVQTPTLALLVNRELEIINFKPEDYYELFGTFTTPDGEDYVGKWKKGKEDRFTDRKKAEAVLAKVKGKNGTIVKHEEKVSQELPPLLYDLTTLQKDCNKRFGFSAQKTLDIAQKLYEKQFTTYPRTSSRHLPEDLKKDMMRILRGLPSTYSAWRDQLLEQKLVYSKRIFDNKKVESHYAIIPTYKTPSSLSPDEEKVYDLIAKSLLKAFFPAAKWANTKIETAVNGEIFHSSGKVLVEAGWRVIEGKSSGDKTKEEILPPVKKDMAVAGKKYDLQKKKTKPPNRYNEASLLTAMATAGKLVEEDELRASMKDRGLGTDATRASIIERLIQVGYVARDKKNLIPTEKGMQLIKTFPIEEVKSPTMTGEWEYKLHQIEKGQLDFDTFRKEIEEFTIDTVERLKNSQGQKFISAANSFGKCPKCGANVVKNKKAWGCSNWKNGCTFTIWNNVICGKKLTDANIKQLLTKGITNKIKGFTSKAGKKFDAKLVLDKDNSGKLNFKF